MIQVNCPACGKRFEYLDLYKGMTVLCRNCKQGIPVPAPSVPAQPTASAPPSSESISAGLPAAIPQAAERLPRTVEPARPALEPVPRARLPLAPRLRTPLHSRRWVVLTVAAIAVGLMVIGVVYGVMRVRDAAIAAQKKRTPELTNVKEIEFNQVLADASKRTFVAFEKLGPGLAVGLNGGKVDGAQLEADYADGLRVVETALADARAVEVPPAASARAFHKAMVQFLEGSHKRYTKDIRLAVKLAADPSLSPSQKKARLKPVLDRAGHEEKAEEAVVRRAQETFAAEFRITLRPTK
jgi:hypothetical protein